MCGISGKVGGSALDIGHIEKIKSTLQHRGPDGNGHWQDKDAGVCLIHTRLSILDLSDAGSQPMESSSGRYMLTFNGEIYNHLELRTELQANKSQSDWRGHSDTETILGALDELGIESTLKKISGMFALAVWDKQKNELHLARDRVGEKPLYYSRIGQSVFFSSDVRSFEIQNGFNAEISLEGLARYIQSGYYDNDHCVFSTVNKVAPGTYVTISDSGNKVTTSVYWCAASSFDTSAANPFAGSETEAVDRAEIILGTAIKNQMLSDVPIGAFLSGGIDSSLVASLMQSHSSNSINTFSIGFEDPRHNEADFAKAIAEHLGTNHTEQYVSNVDLLNTVPLMQSVYDEPFADSSQIPTYLVSGLAKRDVTVCLSGDAGDELYYGYDRYQFTKTLHSRLQYMPRVAAAMLGSMIDGLETGSATLNIGNVNSKSAYGKISNIADKVFKGRKLLSAKSEKELYFLLHQNWSSKNPLLNQTRLQLADFYEYQQFDQRGPDDAMMLIDLLRYLPGDILAKVDRAAMAHSLETRVPFLDKDFIEFSWSIPLNLKYKSGQQKWLLKKMLERHVPKAMFTRPKKGFSVPVNNWLRGPLKSWMCDLCNHTTLTRQGYFNASVVNLRIEQHLTGQRNWGNQLWPIIMFQAWLQDRPSH